MTPERFRKIQEIVAAVLAEPGPNQAATLELLCAGDEALRREAGVFIAAEPGEGFLEPVVTPRFVLESAALSGKLLGAWRLERMLGRGGMGSVFLASRDDGRFQKQAAIKLLDLAAPNPTFEDRFHREAAILARLDHPGIARLLDAGTSPEGVSWFVMEYVEGLSCTEWVKTTGADTGAVVRLFVLICEAVQYAHSNLVVHRDLKPSNILVDSSGQPRLVDFGIARVIAEDATEQTRTGFRAFSLNYASPEQILGKPATTADDVYSLGVVLYEMLAGRAPYSLAGRDLPEILRFVEAPTVEHPLEGDLGAVVLKALAADKARRYESPAALAADLARFLKGFPVLARRPGLWYSARKFLRRRWGMMLAATAVLAALSAGGISTFLQWRRAERRFEESRSLARYVLFDLYDSLSGVPGSMIPLRELAHRTQEYLDRLVADGGSDASLAIDLAASYQRLGDLQGRPYMANLGDTGGALASYGKALALMEGTSARQPANEAVRERLAMVLIGQGRILTRQRRVDLARAALQRAVKLGEALYAGNPGKQSYAELVTEAWLRLGEALTIAAGPGGSVDEYRNVLAVYRKSLAIQEAARLPELQYLRSGALFRIGYTQTTLGDLGAGSHYYDEALETYLQATDIRRRMLAKAPGQSDPQRQFADGLSTVGWARWQCCRDAAGALRDVREAGEILRRLSAADPQNREWFRDTAETEFIMGRILVAAGKGPEARQHLEKALAVYRELVHLDPASGENTSRLAEVQALLTSSRQ